MAFSLIYEEEKYPLQKVFHSDDPFKSMRGSNKINPKDKWRIFNINVGGIETTPIVSSFVNKAGNSYKGVEKGTREITIDFDIIVNGLYSSQFYEELVEQVFESDKPYMFYRDLRPENKRFKDVPPNNIGYRVMKTGLETELVARHKLRVSVTLETVGLPYGISYGSTKDIIDSGNELKFSTEVFGWHQNLKFDENTHPYKKEMKNGVKVRIFNPSRKKVRHYEYCMNVKLSNFTNVSGSKVILLNQTNGTNFEIEVTPTASTIIEQRDNIIYRNGFNEMHKTNWRFIELEKGWNDIILTGTDATAEFIFKLFT